MQQVVHLTRASSNAKTGPIPVSTSSRATCPSSCAFKGAGCYAENFPLKIHWDKVTRGERGMSWDLFCDEISRLPKDQLWRHNQAGDLPGDGDVIDTDQLRQLVRANKGRRGFSYSHKPATKQNVKAMRAAIKAGFTVNLSADSLQQADDLAQHGLPMVVVVPLGWRAGTTPAGRKVVLCPAQTKEYVTCATCQLCQKADRSTIIAFEAHGARRGAVERAIQGETA